MYNKGDIVRIRGDLMVGMCYGDCVFVTRMLPMLNKKVEITRSITNSRNMHRYLISSNDYYWSTEMFESIKPKLFKLL